MKENISQQSLLQESVDGGSEYQREISTSVLYEYSNEHDAVYGPGILYTLGVQDSSDGEKLAMLVRASNDELANIFQNSEVNIAPHTISQDDNTGTVEIISAGITPDIVDDNTRLGYIGTVLDYFETRISDFSELLGGTRDESPLFHTDLAKPSQYVYGRIDQSNDPSLYFVDLDPEITVLATRDEYGWVLAKAFRHSLLEVAATIGLNGNVQDSNAYSERLSDFSSKLLEEGFIDNDTMRRISLLLEGCENIGYDSAVFRLSGQSDTKLVA